MATLTARSAPGQGAASSLVDEAYRALKAAIRENVFPPGYQAAEPEIAQQLGMSRTPVHEAIIRLQEEGLVQVLLAARGRGLRDLARATCARSTT